MNGQSSAMPIKASNCVITKLNVEKEGKKNREDLLLRKRKGRAIKDSSLNEMDE